MLVIKDEETTRVSDALTSEQRKKYLADVRPAPLAGSPDEAPAGHLQTSSESIVAADVVPLPPGEWRPLKQMGPKMLLSK